MKKERQVKQITAEDLKLRGIPPMGAEVIRDNLKQSGVLLTESELRRVFDTDGKEASGNLIRELVCLANRCELSCLILTANKNKESNFDSFDSRTREEKKSISKRNAETIMEELSDNQLFLSLPLITQDDIYISAKKRSPDGITELCISIELNM